MKLADLEFANRYAYEQAKLRALIEGGKIEVIVRTDDLHGKTWSEGSPLASAIRPTVLAVLEADLVFVERRLAELGITVE